MRVKSLSLILLQVITFLAPMSVLSAQEREMGLTEVQPNEIIRDKELVSLLLSKVSEKLHDIHTASYELTQTQFDAPEDLYGIMSHKFKTLECENPSDTNRHAKAIYLDLRTGDFARAYDGTYSYYNRNGEVERSVPFQNHGSVIVDPPFINHLTSLTDYLITVDNPRLSMAIEAYDDRWIIDAKIDSTTTINFYGKPCEFVYPNSYSHFRMVVDKDSLIPSRLSYLAYYPRQKYEIECKNLFINPFPVDSFSVEGYISGLGMSKPKDDVKGHLDWDDYFALIEGKQVPSDILFTSQLDSVSLADFRGQPLFLMLTIPNCGPCKASYPIINKLLEEYAPAGLKGVCVIYADNVDPRSVTKYAKNHGIEFPVWADVEGTVHKYFTQIGAAPMYCFIDKDGILRSFLFGFDAVFPEKSEKKLRRMIEEGLNVL